MTQTDLGEEFLNHHGVKGMRWGVSKEKVTDVARTAGKAAKSVGKVAAATGRFAGDVAFESNLANETSRNSIQMSIASKANKAFKRTDLPAIKAKPEYQKARKLPNRLLHPLDPATKAYRKEAKEAYINRLEQAANSMTNISGTRQYTVRERGWELPAEGGALPRSKHYWAVSSRAVKHADDDEFTMLVEVILDEDGFITDIKEPIEDSMQQTVELGEEFLTHHGVKGMRWGKHKTVEVTVDGKVKKVSARKAKKLDQQFDTQTASSATFVALHNQAADGVNKEMPSFNAGFDAKFGKEKMASGVLWNSRDPITQEYHKAYNEMFTKHLNVAAQKMGTSPTGKHRVKILTANEDSFTDFLWQPTTEKVKHADDVEDELIFIAKLDNKGRVVSVKPKVKSMAQSVELGSEFVSSFLNDDAMEHYGIKGMQWGVRKAAAVTTQTHIDTGLKRRQTKVRAEGGESHPPSEDAINAAVQKQKLKKSGTAALSNKELRDLQTRLQLEAQVELLATRKGKKFVSKQIEETGKQQFQKGVGKGVGVGLKKGAPHVIKKARRGAATAATVAALL